MGLNGNGINGDDSSSVFAGLPGIPTELDPEIPTPPVRLPTPEIIVELLKEAGFKQSKPREEIIGQWREHYLSAALGASGTQIFGDTREATVNRDRYGSANTLTVSSQSSQHISVKLDGRDEKTIAVLDEGDSFTIEANEGIFFNFVKITNLNAAKPMLAGEVAVVMGRLGRGS